MKKGKGLGCHRDAPHRRTQMLVSARTYNLPSNASLEGYEAPIFDQGPYGSCTGHGTAQALYTAFNALHQMLPFIPSPDAIYHLAREIGRADPTAALWDSGAMPADVMTAISQWGISPMGPRVEGRNSDCGGLSINEEIDLATLLASAKSCVTGEYRIDETASDVIEQTCAVLALSMVPVGVAIYVDTQFEDWTSGRDPIDAPDVNDPNGGGHWIVLTGYSTRPNGERVFRGPNSWGTSWGDGGHFEVSEAWLRAAWDIYPFTVRL